MGLVRSNGEHADRAGAGGDGDAKVRLCAADLERRSSGGGFLRGVDAHRAVGPQDLRRKGIAEDDPFAVVIPYALVDPIVKRELVRCRVDYRNRQAAYAERGCGAVADDLNDSRELELPGEGAPDFVDDRQLCGVLLVFGAQARDLVSVPHASADSPLLGHLRMVSASTARTSLIALTFS